MALLHGRADIAVVAGDGTRPADRAKELPGLSGILHAALKYGASRAPSPQQHTADTAAASMAQQRAEAAAATAPQLRHPSVATKPAKQQAGGAAAAAVAQQRVGMAAAGSMAQGAAAEVAQQRQQRAGAGAGGKRGTAAEQAAGGRMQQLVFTTARDAAAVEAAPLQTPTGRRAAAHGVVQPAAVTPLSAGARRVPVPASQRGAQQAAVVQQQLQPAVAGLVSVTPARRPTAAEIHLVAAVADLASTPVRSAALQCAEPSSQGVAAQPAAAATPAGGPVETGILEASTTPGEVVGESAATELPAAAAVATAAAPASSAPEAEHAPTEGARSPDVGGVGGTGGAGGEAPVEIDHGAAAHAAALLRSSHESSGGWVGTGWNTHK